MYCVRVMCNMLRTGPWCRLPLTIRWLKHDYEVDVDCFLGDFECPSMNYTNLLILTLRSKTKSCQYQKIINFDLSLFLKNKLEIVLFTRNLHFWFFNIQGIFLLFLVVVVMVIGSTTVNINLMLNVNILLRIFCEESNW